MGRDGRYAVLATIEEACAEDYLTLDMFGCVIKCWVALYASV